MDIKWFYSEKNDSNLSILSQQKIKNQDTKKENNIKENLQLIVDWKDPLKKVGMKSLLAIPN